MRGGDIGMIFQEPMTSLNPVLTIGRQITETLEEHRGTERRGGARAAPLELLRLVGISDAERRLRQYPHQLSGGMRQRVMIAIALACDPKLIIADEPTTALDVTIQAQILELMQSLTKRLGVALIIITHNLGVVARYAQRVNVMYAGRIVESGSADGPLPQPAPSLYDRAVALGAAARPAAPGAARSDRGLAARSDAAPTGLLVPAALPLRDPALRRGAAAADCRPARRASYPPAIAPTNSATRRAARGRMTVVETVTPAIREHASAGPGREAAARGARPARCISRSPKA